MDLENLRPALINDERSMLIEFLNHFRESLFVKVEGVTDEQARSTNINPSELSLMGLIRHMADVERSWFARTLDGQDSPPIYYDPEPGGDIDGDFHTKETDNLKDAISVWRTEIQNSDIVISQHQLDEIVPAYRDDDDREFMMRWIMIHMIEEYARHCGHADLLRERIDGAVGD